MVVALASDVALYFYMPMKEVSYSCHLGGLVVGLLAGTIFLKSNEIKATRLPLPDTRQVRRLAVSWVWLFCLVILTCFYALGFEWIMTHFPPKEIFSFFWSEPKGCCWDMMAGGPGFETEQYSCIDDHTLIPATQTHTQSPTAAPN